MYDEVGFTIAIDIADLACDRSEILAVAKEHRTHVDVRVCYVAAGNLNYLDMAVQVEQDKVRRMRRAIAVTDYHVHLGGARTTIAEIVLVDVPP